MKKLAFFILVMVFVIVVIPLIIVKGCNFSREALLPAEQKDKLTIMVFKADEKKLVEMELEEYVKGVVAAEMPAEFELEALKAQAVAARTFAFARMNGLFISRDNTHANADICTDHTHCQGWIGKDQAMEKWGGNGNVYWKKIESAVNDTNSIIITYNNEIINPVFHSNSGGRTENAEDVWTCDPYPYLISVESFETEESGNFYNYVVIKREDFVNKLKETYPGIKIDENDILKDIKIEEYSEGGRVKTMSIANVTIKGTEFRQLFSLKSTNFEITGEKDGNIKITTIGSGHGVGMSQWGADYMAEQGNTYDQILQHYYPGTELKVIH